MREWERGSEPYLRVGREDHGRAGGGGGFPVVGSASVSINLGLGGEPCSLCPGLHPLFYALRDRGPSASRRLDVPDQDAVRGSGPVFGLGLVEINITFSPLISSYSLNFGL